MCRLMTKPTKWLCLVKVDQPGHLRCAINGLLRTHVSLCGQRRLWSDWAGYQADLSLRWVHMPFCWFRHVTAHIILTSDWPILALSCKSELLVRTTEKLIPRSQARGRFGRNNRPRCRNFALNWAQGEVGVSLKKKKKKLFFFFKEFSSNHSTKKTVMAIQYHCSLLIFLFNVNNMHNSHFFCKTEWKNVVIARYHFSLPGCHFSLFQLIIWV